MPNSKWENRTKEMTISRLNGASLKYSIYITMPLLVIVALSLGTAAARGGELCFELVDGTVITGRVDVKAVTIRIASGNVLKIPVAELTELNVGLNDRPGLVGRAEALVKALDSAKTRQDARRKLIALGPEVSLVVSRHAASDIPARGAAVAEVLKAYKTWSTDHGGAPEAIVRPLKLRSTVQADVNRFIGTVTVKQFRIASVGGDVTVKLDDIRRIRPGVPTAGIKLGRWTVELRDKTRLEGMVLNRSLRVKTRYGTMAVPLAQIMKADFSADGKPARIRCRGSDRIVGALGAKTTISLKTDKGRVNIPAEKISVLAVHGVLNLDLGKGGAMKLVVIPAGKFLMGSPAAERGRRANEGPQRQVTISKAFYMGATEVTQSQYQAVMGKNPSTFNGVKGPVEQVTWNDAKAFCKALSKKTGKLVVLPTEAQWEYASRGGTRTRFNFGDDDKGLGVHGWFKGNSGGRSQPVGLKKPNAFGLYDMHGNVWEWCRDGFDDKSYARAKNVDPENSTTLRYRVQRGGSWSNDAPLCRSAMRGRSDPDDRNPDFGFRVVVVADQVADQKPLAAW
jgi:formylglycine-generating enzyme required for sulfatase activity